MKPPPRCVEPEILDALPADSPAAAASRRDLRLINGLMGNHRWIRNQVGRCLRSKNSAPLRGWELGAGDGSLGAGLARQFGVTGLQLRGLDFVPRGPLWPEAWGWTQGDLLDLASGEPATGIVIVNLLLHHFDDHQLAQIGSWISGADMIIAVEPLRATFPHLLAYAARLLDINYVTREDIHSSIRAGFSGRELPALLGLEGSEWEVLLSSSPLGAYRMNAQRRPAQ